MRSIEPETHFEVRSWQAAEVEAGASLASVLTPWGLGEPMQFRPVPLHTGEEVDYMLALKQELRASSKNLPFHIQAARTKTDVARYSDKYQNGETKNNCIEWSPDWSRMPKELCIKVRKPRKTVIGAKPQLTRKPKVAAGKEEALQKLETLEKREEEQHSEEEEDEEKKKQNEEEPDADEDYDEEELEDETDYIMSYFDNGEDFGADSEDNMDEAVY
ncbi:DNA-directed RNA polymerase III subunit RPC7-like isoform X2 [Sinocyclocheilus grahami]|uniref:DNA-directed RNA polymerase III subunit RPC7-like isoform X2 n=1 Tax=Sinocyclocheilus grahami TaxID=75366 RepID=UPI0007ACCE7F|nr:PREDICTED: DNA-directed RNA polymerase III subunit RPC7-like isoform X2 [Sinocyclocheilus grahami]